MANAIDLYNGTNSNIPLPVSFRFLDEAHVRVEVYIEDPPVWFLLFNGTDYDLNPATTLLIFKNTGPFGKYPPVGVNNIRFTRVTPHPTPYITFTGSEPSSADIFTGSLKQCLYYTEELEDQI